MRNARNKISFLHNSLGDVLTNPQDIQDEIKLFYKKLLGTHSESLEGIDLRWLEVDEDWLNMPVSY